MVAALAVGCAACDQQARRVLGVGAPQDVTEGQQVEVTITISNVEAEPIIPLALSLYVRPDPMAYLVARRVLGEVEYYKALQATEVRHLATLDRIEAQHVRDAGEWRRVPDSRFLHPRVLLPGQTIAETFSFQAMESHRRLLYCDLYYLPWAAARERVFSRQRPLVVPDDADRYTEVYTRVGEGGLDDPDPQPGNYLLYRPARIHDRAPDLLTRQVELQVRPQKFTYRQAARRARLGARTYCYFSGAAAWVFDYADDGTWFVASDAVTRLKGNYAELVNDLERRHATVITLAAPRQPEDRFRSHLEKAAFCDPTATGPNAVATIPVESLLPILEQAESLGYRVESTTWKPMP